MVQRPRPDLRGGCAAMHIPTVTAGTWHARDERGRAVRADRGSGEAVADRRTERCYRFGHGAGLSRTF